MILKVHKAEERKIVALCDNDILGKKFEEGNLVLDLGAEFYKGIEKSDSEILPEIKSANILNLVGEESVNLGIKLGYINPKNVMRVNGVPHAQAVLD